MSFTNSDGRRDNSDQAESLTSKTKFVDPSVKSLYYDILNYKDTKKIRGVVDIENAERFQEELQSEYQRQLLAEREHRLKKDAKRHKRYLKAENRKLSKKSSHAGCRHGESRHSEHRHKRKKSRSRSPVTSDSSSGNHKRDFKKQKRRHRSRHRSYRGRSSEVSSSDCGTSDSDSSDNYVSKGSEPLPFFMRDASIRAAMKERKQSKKSDASQKKESKKAKSEASRSRSSKHVHSDSFSSSDSNR